jgi:hypothetical protein
MLAPDQAGWFDDRNAERRRCGAWILPIATESLFSLPCILDTESMLM